MPHFAPHLCQRGAILLPLLHLSSNSLALIKYYIYTNLDSHSNLRLYSSVLQIIAKLSSFLSEDFLSSWTKNCWISLKIYVNLTLSGLNLWSAKKDLNACLRNSSLGSPEKLKEKNIKKLNMGPNHLLVLWWKISVKT